MNLWPLQQNCKQYYGDPDTNSDGVPDRAWEDSSLINIFPPYKMYLSWEPSRPYKSLRIHRKCAGSLGLILARIALAFPTIGEIESHGLHLCGGTYNFRTMRGSNRLSMHSYGCAIDIDPENNPLGKAWSKGMIDMRVVEIFESEGWVWGGRWGHRPDCQHFQAAGTS